MASILPVRVRRGRLEFLFGKEKASDATPGWSDFGGGVDRGESPREAAIREAGEELTGFLGSRARVVRLVREALVLQPLPTYTCHIIFLGEEDGDTDQLVLFFNRNAHYVHAHLDPAVIRRSKIFEKTQIRWFTLPEMAQQRHLFRSFYRTIVDHLILHAPHILQHATSS